MPILKIDGGSSAEQQLASVRELKNTLVGDDKAKRSVLALSVVKDVLAFLDAAGDGNSGCGGPFYEPSLLQGVGLLTILCSSPLPERVAEAYLAPSGSRIMRHITRAMEMNFLSRRSGGGGNSNSSEKLTATTLRGISSLCTCLVPATITGTGAEMANQEKLKTLAALKEVSGLILNEIVTTPTAKSGGGGGGGRGRQCWPPSLITLGLEALAAMTRIEVLDYLLCTLTQ